MIKPISTIVLFTVLSGCGATTADNNAVNPMKFDIPTSLPPAPQGYEWRIMPAMSDEFNGNTLDDDKWMDHIPTWRGRPPAKFLTDNVSVKEGMLLLKTSTYSGHDPENFTMGGAAVSGKVGTTYGYFEARIKASKTKLSTTFWLHSDRTENYFSACDNKHQIEIDILEAIGGWPQQDWTNVMHSNTHYKPHEITDRGCRGADYISKGVKYDTGKNLSDDFNVFSAWWVTPNQVKYYFNGKETGTVNLAHKKDPVAFDGDMSLRMVAETYTWQQTLIKSVEGDDNPYPTDAELDDERINTAFYDYVRSYQLVASDKNLLKNADFENTSHWSLSGAIISAKAGSSYTMDNGLVVTSGAVAQQEVRLTKGQPYVLSAYAKTSTSDVHGLLAVKDSQGNVLASKKINEQNFALAEIEFTAMTDKVQVEFTTNDNGTLIIDNTALMAR